MATRGGRRGGNITQRTNQITAVIFGLRENGDIARISAYQSDDAVRPSGPNGNHIVHGSNERSVEGWRREAALVWHLTDVYDIHPMFANGEDEKQRYAELEAKSAERKCQLAEHRQNSDSA